MKKRIRLDRVELWARRDTLAPYVLWLGQNQQSVEKGNILTTIVHSPPSARGEYPICQPGNVVPVVLRPDWSRYRK